MRTPESGMPPAARSRRTTAAPAAVVPLPSTSPPIVFNTISAVKLSLSASIAYSRCESRREWTVPSVTALAGAFARIAPRASTPCWRSSWSKSAAAASRGSRASRCLRKPPLTTSAESGPDSMP